MPPELDLHGLQKLLWSFAQHRVITAAATTGILRRLAEGPATITRVAADLDLDHLATGKLIRALHALGAVVGDGDSYRLAPGLAPAFSGGREDLHPFIAHSFALYQGWGANLEGWVRGEGWPSTASSPERTRAFGEAMVALGTHTAGLLVETLDLADARRLLDVGGGFGHVSRVLLERWPELEATVLDTPAVVEIATGEGGPGAHPRLDFRPGHYLESDYGAGFDAVLLVNVLHQERADAAAEMVRRGARALAPGGQLAVVDFAIDDDQREHLLGCLFAINMRSFGDTYPEPVIRGWLEAAGLVAVERVDLTDYRWMIVGRSPS